MEASPLHKMPSRVPALDGLRGLAILMVFYFHTCSNGLLSPRSRLFSGMGWIGVDLFFVLSGYLVTGILLRESGSPTYYRDFYMRRILRIAPVYSLALLAILEIQPVFHSNMHGTGTQLTHPWLVTVLYCLNLSNLRSAFYPLEIPLASLYWSLAIEEQFYAIWPVTIRRLSSSRLLTVCALGILFSLALRCLPFTQHLNGVYPNFIYRFTPFRLDGLLMGALIAVYTAHRTDWVPFRRAACAAFAAGLGLLLLASRKFSSPGSVQMTMYGYTALALLFGSLVTACILPPGRISGPLQRVLSTTILRSLGRYSYFIYVFHLLILYSIGHVLEKLTRPFSAVAAIYISALLALLICWIAGAVSWKFVEKPVLNFKRYFPVESRAETLDLRQAGPSLATAPSPAAAPVRSRPHPVETRL